MKIIIEATVEDEELVDAAHSTGITEAAFLLLSQGLGEAGFSIQDAHKA